MTPHNQAAKNDIAKNVLMPGDPLRAKFIAENYLENYKLVNTVRNMFAFTGTYKGKEVTVMGSGMGMPSIGIYSYELFTKYDVENIIRIGSAGSYSGDLNVYDVVLAKAAWSRSSFALVQNGYDKDTTYPSEKLNKKIEKAAEKLNIKLHKDIVHSSDVFYAESNTMGFEELRDKYNCSCVEMESFALFHNANVLGKNAACLLTISDSFVSKEEISAEKRQESFHDMMKIALESLLID